MKKLTREDFDEKILARYEMGDRIGKGTYGTVYKCFDKVTNSYVAIKKTYEALCNKDDSLRTLREIKLYEHFRGHPNIIKLLNVVKGENNRDVYLIFELMEANLSNVIRAKILSEQHIKYVTYQILKAMKCIHSSDIMLRDLKPSNILINSDCKLKLSDFTLAKSTNISDEYRQNITDYMSLRYYKAPEILLTANTYDQSVDMWTIGCLIGEIINGKVVFPGSGTVNQITLIIELIGKPTPEDIRK